LNFTVHLCIALKQKLRVLRELRGKKDRENPCQSVVKKPPKKPFFSEKLRFDNETAIAIIRGTYPPEFTRRRRGGTDLSAAGGLNHQERTKYEIQKNYLVIGNNSYWFICSSQGGEKAGRIRPAQRASGRGERC
jgi:hypothetical protein